MVSDEQLIHEIKKGNTASIDVLVKRYYKNVYNFIYRNVYYKVTASDLTQEVFIKFMKNIHRYSEEGSFKSWLLTIASNQCKDYFRSKEAKMELMSVPLEENDFNVEYGTSLPSELIRKEKRMHIIQAMQQLPYEQHEVINLRFFQEMKMNEIAKITNVSESTVKSRLYRGIQKLEGLLERSDFYERGN